MLPRTATRLVSGFGVCFDRFASGSRAAAGNCGGKLRRARGALRARHPPVSVERARRWCGRCLCMWSGALRWRGLRRRRWAGMRGRRRCRWSGRVSLARLPSVQVDLGRDRKTLLKVTIRDSNLFAVPLAQRVRWPSWNCLHGGCDGA
jgi:hypothetical protein